MEHYLYDCFAETLLCNEIFKVFTCTRQTEHIVEVDITDDVRQNLVW
jgi:hypothetical protein